MTKKHEPKHMKRECQITEEWDGPTIGRRYCTTHRAKWDGGGPCPKEEK